MIAADYDILAPERWNVEKQRREGNAELLKFKKKQGEKLKRIKAVSGEKLAQLYGKLYSIIRWSYPVIAARYQKIIFDYADFILDSNDNGKFHEELLLQAWFDRQQHTDTEKTAKEIRDVFSSMQRIIDRREDKLEVTKKYLDQKSLSMTIKTEGKLRWKMETNINTRDRHWNIWYLAHHGKAEDLMRFLQTRKSADIDELDQDFGFSALHYGCRRDDRDIVQCLLRHGADVNRTAVDGRTPLHFAASYSSKPLVLELLGSGANVDAKDRFGCTALDLALQNGNLSVTGVLENWNAMASTTNDVNGETSRTLLSRGPFSQLPLEQSQGTSLSAEQYASSSSDTDNADFMDTTPAPVVASMSLKLQVLTMRLKSTGNSATRLNNTRATLVTLRLCEKQASLCFLEGFVEVGLETLKRRWLLARLACSGTGTGKTPLRSSDVPASSETIVEGESQDLGITAGSHPTSREDGGAAVTPSYALQTGIEYAEQLIKLEREGAADAVLRDALLLQSLTASSRISALQKRCMVLLFIHDQIQRDGVVVKRTNVFTVSGHSDLHINCSPASGPMDAVLCEADDSSSDNVALHKYLRTVSALCEELARTAIDLHYRLYCGEVLEPPSLVPLLELLAAALERKGMLAAAVDKLNHAGTVCERSLGYAHKDTIRVLLESVRVQLRCVTREGYAHVARVATDVSRRVDILLRLEPEAAPALAKRCAELIALTALLEQGQLNLSQSLNELQPMNLLP